MTYTCNFYMISSPFLLCVLIACLNELQIILLKIFDIGKRLLSSRQSSDSGIKLTRK